MKKILFFLTCAIALLAASPQASAYSFYAVNDDGVTIYYKKSGSNVLVTYKSSSNNSSAYSGEVNIPATVVNQGTKYTVIGIGDRAFFSCAGLTKVTFPNSVTSIGDNAFYVCKGLTEVTIPNSVTSIGNYAFQGCTGLTEVTIPNSVTSIGASAFSGCTGLTEVTIPNSVTSIGASAFYRCTGLTEITIPNSVTSIGNYAFQGCTGLKTVTLADGETTLEFGSTVFSNTQIETLYLGRYFTCSSLTSGDQPFYNQGSLTNLTIGNSVTTIANSALYGCTGLTEVTIPTSVTSIGRSAFSGCTGLTEVTIPTSVTSIGSSAFSGCTGLTEVTIPNSVTEIGSSVFSGCTGLTEVTIPNTVTSIGDNAFYGCTGLTEVTIPNTVTSIGSSAFRDCTGLTEVTIPNSVTEIGQYVFSGCTGLTEVTIPNSVTEIGERAFNACTGLTEITIPNTVTSIGGSAFDCCTGLTEVTIPNTVTSIGNYAFSGCTGLENVTIEDGEATLQIGGDVFFRATIGTLYLGRNYTGGLPFFNQSGIASLTIGNSVTSIGDYAFTYCSGLKELTIGNSVTSIGNSAFEGCSGLKGVIIPGSVTSLATNAFANCSNLKIAIPSHLTSGGGANIVVYYPEDYVIEDGAIYNSVKTALYYVPTNVEGVFTIPELIQSIGENAFTGCGQITEIKAMWTTPASMYENSFAGLYGTATLDVPDGTLQDYLTQYYWYLFENIQAGGETASVAEVDDFRFILDPQTNEATIIGISSGNEGKSSYSIPRRARIAGANRNVTAIGVGVFSGMTSITSIEFNGTNLKIISSNAFKGCTKLSSINLPENVETVGDGAFQNCTNLTTATFNANLKTIGKSAFQGCTTLSTVTFNGNLESIGQSAFQGCTGLSRVLLRGNLKSIGQSAFQGCTSLSSVTFNKNLETIGASAFQSSGLTSVVIPDNVTELGESAFEVCDKLTSVAFGTGITTIQNDTFNGCTALTDIEIPEQVTKIGSGAFYYCQRLATVSLGGVESIGAGAFQSCAIASIDLGKVKTIGDRAFYQNKMADVVIPSTVESIGAEAFRYNSVCRKVTIKEGANALSVAKNSFGTTVTNIYVGRNCADWSFVKTLPITTLTIGNNVTELPAGLAKDMRSITSLTLGSGLTEIPASAFQGCTGLTEVVMPSNLTSIGDNAFDGCTSIRKIKIGSKVEEIGDRAFYGTEETSNMESVCVAAVTPPTISDNTFSVWSTQLYVPEDCIDAYDDDDYWTSFYDYKEAKGLVEITTLTVNGDGVVDGVIAGAEAGNTYELTPTFGPSNATLPYIFWRSTNPMVATVDVNGLVTIQDNGGLAESATIIAETMYHDGPVAQVVVSLAGLSELALVDGEEYTRTVGLSGMDVTYERNFTSTDWQALYLPYNMAYADWADVADVAELTGAVEDGDDIILEWNRVASGEITAGKPYIIKPYETGTVVFESADCDVAAATDKQDLVFAVDGGTVTLSGTYVTKTDMASTHAFGIAGGEFRPTNSDEKTLKPFRIFLTLDGVSPTKIRNVVNDVEDTGIEDILNGIEDDGDYYDLMGRKVVNPRTGVYIHNGKKVFIRN